MSTRLDALQTLILNSTAISAFGYWYSRTSDFSIS